MTETSKPNAGKIIAVPIEPNEMVALMIRSFFVVPEELTTKEVIAKTDPNFVECCRHAVQEIMLYWRNQIAGSMDAKKAALATSAAGIEERGSTQ